MEKRQTSKNLGYYFLILGGHATSLFGSSVVQFIIIWWITSETSSIFYLSLTLFLTFLPQVIITLFAGVLSDILNRKLILVIANIVRISTTLALIFLFAFGTFELNILLLISIIRSISQAFYIPTFYTILPSMVSQKH
ncbi:MAG: MFS transporter, partial [Candidatus Lokiarchaeota archaeon]|nr:MFS transporter [Candidatus Lokiarchaeota archaeon]